jgi:hypothetical protein
LIKTIRISPKTHQRLTNLAKWGEPLEQVIIKLLSTHEDLLSTQEKLAKFYDYLLNLEKERDIRELTPIIAKFKETFL